MNPPSLRRWLALCALLISLLANTSAQTLINVNVGPGMKVGPAAAGSTTNDFWNSFYPTNAMGQLFDPSLLVPLFTADYTNAGAGMLMVNMALAGTNATGAPAAPMTIRA